jgi:hypothetical protein
MKEEQTDNESRRVGTVTETIKRRVKETAKRRIGWTKGRHEIQCAFGNTVCVWDTEGLKEIYALWFGPTSREGCPTLLPEYDLEKSLTLESKGAAMLCFREFSVLY